MESLRISGRVWQSTPLIITILTILLFFSGRCEAYTIEESSTSTSANCSSYYDQFLEYGRLILYYTCDDNVTLCNTTYSIADAAQLLENPKFKNNTKLMCYLHGYHNRQATEAVTEMFAVLCSGDIRNVIGIGWEHFAFDDYNAVAPCARDFLGRDFGRLLCRITANSTKTVDASSVHLVGSSLGCHIAGGMAKGFAEVCGKKPGRITALDAAGIYFSHHPDQCLNANDAVLVDVIHTDAGGLGINKSIGTCDFYPNGGSNQPGTNMTSTGPDLVEKYSHKFANSLFRDSVKYRDSFPSIKKFDNGSFSADPNDIMHMGFDCPNNCKGNYYLTTNSQSIYSKGYEGIEEYRRETEEEETK